MLDREQRHKDKQAIIRHFQELFERHGGSFESLGFGRRASQQQRFDLLCQVGEMSHASVLDVCCGLADLAEYLERHHPSATYTGVEIVPAFVEEVKRRHAEWDVRLFDIALDRTEQRWDYVLASGIFYREVADSEELLRTCVANLFTLCNKAVAFNTLSTYADHKDEGEFLASPEAVFTYCKSLTPYVTLRHDYMPHDFTVYLYKEPPSA